MIQMNLSTKQKQTHGQREQTCSCQGGWGWGGTEREAGGRRCKLLYMEWKSNKVPTVEHRELYSIVYDKS